MRIPPPLVVLGTGFAMWAISKSPFALGFTLPFVREVAVALVAFGAVVMVLAVAQFRRVGTTIDPLQPQTASTLVTTGIFSISRNPMYLGMLLILTAWAIRLSSVSNFALLFFFVWYINKFQIRPEETALKTVFGSAFDLYCQKVRRWL